MMHNNDCSPVGYVILKSGKILTSHFEKGKLFGTKLQFMVLSELVSKEDYDQAEKIRPGKPRKKQIV